MGLDQDPALPGRGAAGWGGIEEVAARVNDLTTPRTIYDLTVAQHPLKTVMLCQKGRILSRSDRRE